MGETWGPDEDPFEEDRLRVDTPGLDAQREAGISFPLIGGELKDEKFIVDGREKEHPVPVPETPFPEIVPPDFSTNLAPASEVPPVAIKSSTINTFSLDFKESLCISNVALPYSNLNS